MEYNIVYTLSGPDGAVRFVGTTTTGLRQRVIRYKSAIKGPGTSPLLEWIREVGYENINPRVVETLPSPEGLKARGEHWVDVFRNGGHNLLNVTPEEFAGRVRKALSDPEVRKRISVAKAGVPKSEETKARMAAARKVRGITEEGRRRISEVHTGKIVSEETRKLISQRAMGHTRNAGKVHTMEARTKMSHSRHLVIHAETPKAGCRWCEGLTLEEALRGLA